MPHSGILINKRIQTALFTVVGIGSLILMILVDRQLTVHSLYGQMPIIIINNSAIAPNHQFPLQYVPFGRAYIGIPNFYIKRGFTKTKHDANLLTLCSVCSPDILNQAYTLSTNYPSGPLSIAMYVDKDINSSTQLAQNDLRSWIDSHFENVNASYDIYVGVIYYNKTSPFWTDYLRFSSDTQMSWKLPVNALRNLAEYQVKTRWLLTVDIDFELYSSTIVHKRFLNSTLRHMTDTYPEDTIFIVPAFKVTKKKAVANDVTKSELKTLIEEDLALPFYYNSPYQNCTDYPRWYKAETNYLLDIKKCPNKHYEPFYIIKTHVSRKYHWDSDYTGRHLDKIQRMKLLRYSNFFVVVLADLFTIHTPHPHVHIRKNKSRDYHELNNGLMKDAEYRDCCG